MNESPFPISRRTVLRGMGASPRACRCWRRCSRSRAPAAEAGKPPAAAAVHLRARRRERRRVDAAAAKAPTTEPRFTLTALEPVRQDVLVLSGLNGRQGETGRQRPSAGLRPLALQRADQRARPRRLLHRHLHRPDRRPADRPHTRLPSIELGCDRDAIAASHQQHLLARPQLADGQGGRSAGRLRRGCSAIPQPTATSRACWTWCWRTPAAPRSGWAASTAPSSTSISTRCARSSAASSSPSGTPRSTGRREIDLPGRDPRRIIWSTCGC